MLSRLKEWWSRPDWDREYDIYLRTEYKSDYHRYRPITQYMGPHWVDYRR